MQRMNQILSDNTTISTPSLAVQHCYHLSCVTMLTIQQCGWQILTGHSVGTSFRIQASQQKMTLLLGGHGGQPSKTNARVASTHATWWCHNIPWIAGSGGISVVSHTVSSATITNARELVSHHVGFKMIRTSWPRICHISGVGGLSGRKIWQTITKSKAFGRQLDY